MHSVVNQAFEVLQRGGTILYPTDTIWGLGCDATNAQAVEKILAIKHRPDHKSLIVLIDTMARLGTYVCQVPEQAYDLVQMATKPLTIIYPEAKNLAHNVIAPDRSIGIRVVNHRFCQRLIGRLGKPLVSTSANISGKPHPTAFANIDEQIKQAVDFVVPQNLENEASHKPSGIIALGPGGLVKIIRE